MSVYKLEGFVLLLWSYVNRCANLYFPILLTVELYFLGHEYECSHWVVNCWPNSQSLHSYGCLLLAHEGADMEWQCQLTYTFLFSPNLFQDLYFQSQDVIELREHKWVSCTQVAAPATIAQIHEGVCLLLFRCDLTSMLTNPSFSKRQRIGPLLKRSPSSSRWASPRKSIPHPLPHPIYPNLRTQSWHPHIIGLATDSEHDRRQRQDHLTQYLSGPVNSGAGESG
jgi:hypothetical protein